jgi:hypothetical protein
MSTEVTVALIAATTSLVVSGIGYYFQQKELRKRLDRMFTDRLYNMRLDSYPPAFDITDQIKNRPKPEGIIPKEKLDQIRYDLISWKKGAVNIAISSDSLSAYYNLTKALNMGYELKDQFSEVQIKKIFDARNEFRKNLRADLGYLYTEERSDNLIQRAKKKFGY